MGVHGLLYPVVLARTCTCTTGTHSHGTAGHGTWYDVSIGKGNQPGM